MNIDEIEYKIACGELNAAQVFTQMKQHVSTGNKWISVKGNPPEQLQGNIVVGHNGSYLFECEFDDGFWCNIGGDEMNHWMPLPEPPK